MEHMSLSVSTTPQREKRTWLSSAQASAYINPEQRAVIKLTEDRKIKFTRAPSTKKLMFHRRWLDAYLLGYGAEPTAEEEAELERLNRY